MRKIIAILLSLSCVYQSFACDCCHGFSAVLKQGYFYPQDCTLSEMFKTGGGSKGGYYVEGAFRYDIAGNCCRCINEIDLEINGGYFSHKGHSLIYVLDQASSSTVCPPQVAPCRCGEPVCYKLPMFGFGIKFLFGDRCHDWVNAFIGGGLKAFFMRTGGPDTNAGIVRQVYKRDVGGVLQTGLLFKVRHALLIELFLDYMARTTCCKCLPGTPATSIKLGGVAAGIGIGVQF